MPRKLTLISIAVLLVAGCGGSHKTKSTTTSTATTHTATHTATGKTPVAHKPSPLSELIAVAGSHHPASTSASTGTANGAGVVFLTRAPGTPTSPSVKVHLDFSHKAANKWVVTASVKGQKSVATLATTAGKTLMLSDFRYGCALPPAATFCPARHLASTSNNISGEFRTTPLTPIVITAVTGPLTTAPVTTPTSTLVAPTYTVLSTVLDLPKHRSKTATPARYGPSAAVHAGDHILLRVGVTGSVVGASQPVTLTLGQGPAKSITLSAAIPGGTTSTATITSATGGRITLVLPRYGCLLPPAPTFCPPSKVVAASHKYKLTFKVTPKTPPVVVEAAIQGG